jgi:hypothetical protein
MDNISKNKAMEGNDVVVKICGDDVMTVMVVRTVKDDDYLQRWRHSHPSWMSHAERFVEYMKTEI